MALTDTTQKVSYNGDGATVTFAIPMEFFSTDSNIEVWLRDQSVTPATETLQTNPTEYSISGTNVVMVTAPADNGGGVGEVLVIKRVLALQQPLDFLDNEEFPADSHETALDKLTAISQQLAEEIDRSLKLPETSPISAFQLPEAEATKALVWNATEDGLENQDLTISVERFRAGTENIAASATQSVVTFATALASTNYAVTCNLQNTIDSNPSQQPITIVNKLTTGFTAEWNAPVSGSNYKLEYTVLDHN